ncbi:hypothetical protein DE146DRAFT_294335 [Phaeosphaeria sp. MPI-PUGE-AT-0046c]|nr:hypothetical protein DE146DRAFT_294335 [Phaeosphaeria sp. MPI-PUGE-AT-0046c]
MTCSLDRLPFDILYYIASSLHLDDVVHLGQTCRQLKAFLEEKTLQRRIVENLPHAKETKLARAGHISYSQALQSIFDRRHAISNAYPFSARKFGQGDAFLYRHGVLCVSTGDVVCVSEVRAPWGSVRLDLTAIVCPILQSAFSILGSIKTTLLYYNEGILAIYVENETRSNAGHIFAISTAQEGNGHSRVITALQLTSNSKLFVRHNSRYLYYGTHTGIGDDGHHKWEISGVSLDDQILLPEAERPLLFEDFHGTDIGSTVAFEIFNDYFYAVSNQGTFEVEELDWTSFYHCIRFPLDNPVTKAMLRDERVYRRQHAQGPIHDSWTDLSLQVSERTNEIMILESRREWVQASSRQSRTFYTTPFRVNLKGSSRESSPSEDASEMVLLPEDDLFVDILDSSNKPNWMPTPNLYSWSQHPEFAKTDTAPRSFILARTKFRAYNYSCTSFLDLVEDEHCCNDASKPPCLRLRVGSRRESGLKNSAPDIKGKGRANAVIEPVFADLVEYRSSPITLWPPPASRCACSSRLHDILNPQLPLGPSYARSVIGVLDDRTLVYMIKVGRSYGASNEGALGTVVVIDFTRPDNIVESTISPTAPTLARCDSKMANDNDDEAGKEASDDFDASCWQWAIGQNRRCKSGTCR